MRLVSFQDESVWHENDEEDELFLEIEGSFEMRFRDRAETNRGDEFIIVPRGLELCRRADSETRVLLFEPASTLNTGDVGNDATVRELERL